MRSSLRHIPLIATIAAAALGGSVVGRAQSSPSASDTLSSLLIEVRGLRAAMEQLVSAGPRIQLAMGRLQLQEQRVTEVTRRLDDVKNALAKLQKQADSEDEETKMLEDAIPRTTDPKRQQELENALKQMKFSARERAPEILRMQGEQATLMQELANEQTRVADFNQRLDELERALKR
jgi:chromosome segregation ATPase